MPRTLPALLALTLSTPALAQETERQYLSGIDKDRTVAWEFMVDGGRRAGEWTTVPVPSNWELQGFGTYNYGNDKNKAAERGHYRHRFDVPKAWRGRRVVLVFEGSMTDTEVKVNGKPAGPVHQGGFYEFRYDVTGLLRYGGANLLEAVVSKQSANVSITRAERDADFWVFGGIFRPVYLAAYPAASIDRVAIDARADGTFRMDAFLEGAAPGARVTARIEQLDGASVGEAFSTDVAAGQAQATLRTRIENPRLWSAEQPNLYRVRVALEGASGAIHRTSQRFGFRTIDVRPHDGIYVNGARVILKGVNRHSFWPDSGRTTSAEISVRDVQAMKDMNMNAVRMSHYPPDTHFLDACDELGLYVLDELTGWQKAYDTDAGRPLVRELVVRDVNHPSILFWANGNEGGFNFDLDAEFAKWDPQQRVVLHPWDTFNGFDTTHYLPWGCCAQQFFNGPEIIMPTEFLHGLYDGGHGAGLRDYWRLIEQHQAPGGGFLWVLADEGIVRTDRNGEIDAAGNQGADGIVGPYRQKEGSFYAIKELWSPVAIDASPLPPSFDGRLEVANKYSFTSLDRHTFRWQLLKFRLPQDREAGHAVLKEGTAPPPALAPGARGEIDLRLPSDWRSADALSLSVTDHTGRELWTWRWMLATHEATSRTIVGRGSSPAGANAASTQAQSPTARVDANRIIVTAGDLELTFDSTSARLAGVRRAGTPVSLTNGPRSVTGETKPTDVKHFADGDAYVVEARSTGALRLVRWRVRASGWTTLEYELRPGSGEYAHLGVTFDYPEQQVTGMRWLGRGPYRVWKNRLDGVTHDVWEKKANDAVTGVKWEYPEFRGHHADLYWATIQTTEAPITLVSETPGLFLRMLTPPPAPDPRHTAVTFPDGNISLLHGITPIGTKFNPPANLGPQSQMNRVNGRTGRYQGRVHVHFGETPTAAIWPQWRGPSGLGVSAESGLPTTWSADENVAWSAPLAGLGSSSPIVWNDRVFVTSQAGRAPSRSGSHPQLARDDAALVARETPIGGRHAASSGAGPIELVVEAFGRGDGRRLWEYRLAAEGPFPDLHEKHNLATPTPVTDGRHLFAWFGTGQLVALDLSGALLWKRHLGREYSPFDVNWGHGSSPVLYRDLLILLCDHESKSYLLAIDARTGKERWKADRGAGRVSFSTPLVVSGSGGDELIVNSSERVDAYDPATGRLLWHADAPRQTPIPSAVFDDGVIYLTRGYRNSPYFALRHGGRGDVSSSHVLWRAPGGGSYVPSLLYYDGLLYLTNDVGVLTCADARTGARVWQARLDGVFFASPVAADGKVYFVSQTGETIVVRAGRRPEILARNDLGVRLVASPAIAGGRILLRSDSRLFAIGRADGRASRLP